MARARPARARRGTAAPPCRAAQCRRADIPARARPGEGAGVPCRAVGHAGPERRSGLRGAATAAAGGDGGRRWNRSAKARTEASELRSSRRGDADPRAAPSRLRPSMSLTKGWREDQRREEARSAAAGRGGAALRRRRRGRVAARERERRREGEEGAERDRAATRGRRGSGAALKRAANMPAH